MAKCIVSSREMREPKSLTNLNLELVWEEKSIYLSRTYYIKVMAVRKEGGKKPREGEGGRESVRMNF